LTIPVSKKGKRDQLINEVEIQYGGEFPNNHIKAITMAYSRAPYFAEYSPKVLAVLEKRPALLADFSIEMIETVNSLLGLECKLMRSSSLTASGSKADLLADICSQLGANVYLSAPASREYIELSDAFQTRGIDVVYNEYHHPQYHQLFGEFLPYMGVIDLLFNEGPRGLEVLRSGIREPVGAKNA
jgi:hypothetical protein